MADALIGVVTEALLNKAISLANEWISGVLGVKKDLQSLAEQLEQIQALLSDAGSRSTTNKPIEDWLKELEDAATDTDDLLDEFAYEVLSKKMMKGNGNKVSSIFSSSIPLGFRFKMPSKIKRINSKMNEIFQKANKIGIRPTEIIYSPTNPREVLLTDPFVDESKIVGRSDDVSKIVSQLTSSNDEKDLPVIGIIGMGGQGKTALAKLLINNNQVKEYFKKTVWTCVSDDFNVDRILSDMLQSLKGEASKLTLRKAIVEELSKFLKGERFLLVLDDVWNKENKDSELGELWDIMKVSLQEMGGLKGSQIIVTTRDERVVTIMNGFVYQLGVLSGEASQELFEKMAFGTGGAARTPQLVQTGERIAAKCGGVPLALKAIGRLMSSQRGEREWLKIEESSVWSTLDGVRSTLRLSFDHLPSLSLKQCFTYCSIFPKDSVIRKDGTIQQWMANGLLNPSSGSDLEMEDVGNNYFKILLQRSLLQEAKFDMNDNIISCKMHDLVHDFALEASKGRCLTTKIGELSDDIKALHLSIVPDGRDNLNISEKKILRLRTLSDYFSNKNFLVHCKCKHLRALTLADRGMLELPISIAMMKHLRYLDISKTGIDVLPAFISKLYNLQTLRFSFVRNLPKDFDRLVNLRHLYIKEERYLSFDDWKPPLLSGIGQLTSLRILNNFFVTKAKGCQIEELCNLNHLGGSIRIVGLENVANENDARNANLSGKRNIENLELVWRNGSNKDESVLEGLQPHVFLKALKIQDFMGRSLPSWIPLVHNLTSLDLFRLGNCEQIPPLGHLPFLKILHIKEMHAVKCIGNDFYGWSNLNTVNAYSSQTSRVVSLFPSLKTLTFFMMSSLEQWSDMVQPSFVFSSSVELFPSLEEFEVAYCPLLTHLPECLLSASTGLESLSILFCEKLVSVPNLNSLHSLQKLRIADCQEISALPGGIEACKSLKKLTITCDARVMESLFNCFTNIRQLTSQLSNNVIDHHVPMEPIFNTTEDDIQGRDNLFSTVVDLTLIGVPQMKSLPEQIQCFSALRNLMFYRLEGLKTLPEWLSNFHSLESLKLWLCQSLANFPSVAVMRGLTNLKYLGILNCPILKQRCHRETGAEWHKIAHIPEIFIP